jgi:hypothetical protein
VLLCDKNRKDSILFLEQMMENIINFSVCPKNIYLIINHCPDYCVSKHEEKENLFILNKIISKYDIPKHNISYFTNFSLKNFNKFLISSLIRKKSNTCPNLHSKKILGPSNLNKYCKISTNKSISPFRKNLNISFEKLSKGSKC